MPIPECTLLDRRCGDSQVNTFWLQWGFLPSTHSLIAVLPLPKYTLLDDTDIPSQVHTPLMQWWQFPTTHSLIAAMPLYRYTLPDFSGATAQVHTPWLQWCHILSKHSRIAGEPLPKYTLLSVLLSKYTLLDCSGATSQLHTYWWQQRYFQRTENPETNIGWAKGRHSWWHWRFLCIGPASKQCESEYGKFEGQGGKTVPLGESWGCLHCPEWPSPKGQC